MSDWTNNNNGGDAAAFGGGSSTPSLKFETVGQTHTGIVTNVTRRDDTKPDGTLNTWPDGKVKDVWVFELDGAAAIWVRGNAITAIRTAQREAGLTNPLGARLELQFYGLGDPKPGKAAAKLFKARMTAPAPVAATPANW